MATEPAKSEQQRLRKELGEKAVAFYAKHNVTETVEKLLNEMFVAAPTDVYGYMVRLHVYVATWLLSFSGVNMHNSLSCYMRIIDCSSRCNSSPCFTNGGM